MMSRRFVVGGSLQLIAGLSVALCFCLGFAQQQELWVYKHKGDGDRKIARAHAIVYGTDGNIYVAGTSGKPPPNLQTPYFTVISLNPDGSLRWEYYCDQENPPYADDAAYSLVHTGDTLVYAVGQLRKSTGDNDFIVVCLDSRTGQQIWKRFFGGLDNDQGFAVTCDKDGNAYACGYLNPNTIGLFYVVSLTPEGNTRWTYDTTGNYAGQNRALSLVYGPGNHLYVAGYLTNLNSPNQGQPDAVVIALCTEASVPQRRRWTYLYNYANLQDSATSIAKGSDGHLYVTGGSNAHYISTYEDIFVAALDSATGGLLWPQVFRWNGTGPSGHGDIASRIVYGIDSNLYLCGRSDTTWASSATHSDYYVMSIVKNNPVTPRWCFRYGPINEKNDYAQSIVYGLDDNIYTAGQTAYTDGEALYTVVSLDKDDGSSRFTHLYPQPNPSTDFKHWASDIVYGVDGGVYSCGHTYYRALDPGCSLTVVKIGTPNLLGNGNTYPSQSRHMAKDPFSSSVHAVFQRDNNVYYRMSTDAGTTWGGAQYLGRGTSPSICLAQSPFFAKIPCVVYCDVDTLNRFHYHWQAFSGWEHAILSVPGANPCTPSAVAAGDTVFIGYEMRWEDDDQDVPCIMVKRLHYSTPASQIDTVIAGTDVGMPEMPCLSVDDNFTIHAVWRQNNGTSDDDIAYSYRKADSSWKQAAKVRNLPYSPSMQPFCECYGDSVFVVWCEQDTSAHESLEVWRAARQLPNWWQFRNVSSSSSLSSESPTQANRQFVVWAEQISGSNYDIKYRRYKPDGQVDSGFVAQNTTYSYWPHSQFDFISPTTYLYSLRTEDNDAVYFQNQVFASDEDMLFYSAEAGGQGRSPYCTKRDSFISYEKCPVDIARDELVYDLSFFDPAYIYKIKAVVYHEGIARKAKISLDNWEIAAYSFPESKVETISVWIPPEAYRQDHRATLKVKNLAGDYAVMGPLLVYRYAKRSSSQGGGGVQSSEITDALRKMKVTVAPTVTRRTFAISYDLPASTRVEIELFDVTGRKARSIQGKRQRAGSYRIVLDGAELASGVYFLRFTNQVKTETKKVVVSK